MNSPRRVEMTVRSRMFSYSSIPGKYYDEIITIDSNIILLCTYNAVCANESEVKTKCKVPSYY
jgi:hypothetical protein